MLSKSLPFSLLRNIFLISAASVLALAAPPDRIKTSLNTQRIVPAKGSLHRLAASALASGKDLGTVEPGFVMDNVLLMFKPSDAQQADLDRLLVDQQNPSSPDYHKWLTPEEFGARFGVSPGDESKVIAWLESEGFTLNHRARGKNWLTFSGSAAQVSRSFHTSIHKIEVNGKPHFANITEAAIPAAIADVFGGFLGLNDLQRVSNAKVLGNVDAPSFTSTTGAHYLAPEDFATIYNLGPLYKAGLDGTGQSIGIVGEFALPLDDVRSFRARYGLPANDPVLYPYAATGTLDAETQLDVEWSGAVAPRATINYIYGPNVDVALIYAISINVSPVLSFSYGGCEVDFRELYYRAYLQQANAQGVTVLASSGDGGAAGCWDQFNAIATHGPGLGNPASYPEVTAVGGTQFNEGRGNYWSGTNSTNRGSALSYIPEVVWNETYTDGIIEGSTGGASVIYAKPDWQTGPGVPNDGARDVPDISLSAACHDAYLVTYTGATYAVCGTSASSPSLAGIIAILNQNLVAKGVLKKAGLGNMNPQLYRFAQTSPAVFHDIVTGDNIQPCAQGTPGCTDGAYGYVAGPGYDLTTGVGSIDANAFVNQWANTVNTPTVTVTSSVSAPTLNDAVTLTATVAPSKGSLLPTGKVAFSSGSIALGSATLVANGNNSSATITVLASTIGNGTGSFTITGQYLGDGAFSAAGGTARVTVSAPRGVSAIISTVTVPEPFPNLDAQGSVWQERVQLREAAGVPAILTGFTIDGQAQSLSQYFATTSIPAGGTLLSNVIVFRNVTPLPATKTFGFTGIDAAGQTWARSATALLQPVTVFPGGENVTAEPLTMFQNKAADPGCQWSQRIYIEELFGGASNGVNSSVVALFQGGIDRSSQISSIFGSTRLAPFGSMSGNLCWAQATPGSSDAVQVNFDDGSVQVLQVSFTGAPAVTTQIAAQPSAISLAADDASTTPTATLNVTLTENGQPSTQAWTASIYPGNFSGSWLQVSPSAGTGSGKITLTASGNGFGQGAYRAVVILKSPNAAPVTIPVLFVLGASGGTTLTSVVNAATYAQTAAPGMLLTLRGTQLAPTTASYPTNNLPGDAKGSFVTINGQVAPILYASPTQMNIQVPYELGVGPAAVGVNNNGQIAGFLIQLAPTAPGIFADANGFVAGAATLKGGATGALVITGDGDVASTIPTGVTPASTTTVASQPKSRQTPSLTIGGVPVFIQSYGIAPGLVGATKIIFTLPSTVPTGVQPAVVTVGGVSSPAVNINVTP